MKTKAGFTWFVLITLLLAGLACNMPFSISPADTATPQPIDAAGTQKPTLPGATAAPQTGASATPASKATALPPTATVKPTTKAPNAIPLPIRQGLTSLNTYRLKIHQVTNGPTKDDKNDTTTLIEVNSKTNSTHTRIESTASSAEDPKPEKNVSDNYTVGNTTCEISGTSSTPTGKITQDDPFTKDLTGTVTNLVDFSLYVENPVFVAEENLNGVAANHFTFKVTRLGKDSGAIVNQNSGEYWVAKDGQYLVKYVVILDISSDKAGTKMMHSETNLELSAINQPIDIAIPANCAKK
jgi:hypothetical protein